MSGGKLSSETRLTILLSVFWGALVSFWSIRPIWDIDLGWHIAVGRFILANGFPTTDFLSAADPTRPWVTFQGGYEILVAWLDSVGGLFLIRLVHAIAIGTGFGFLWHLARRLGLSAIACGIVLAIALILYEDRIRVRPHVFHFLFLIIMLHAVVRRSDEATLRTTWWVWPLQGLWAFVHGPASLWGLALLGAVAVASPTRITGYVLFLGSLATSCSVPGFLAGIRSSFFVHTESNLQSTLVPEHWPLWHYPSQITVFHGKLVPLIVGVILFCAALALVRQRSLLSGRWAFVLVSLGMGIFSVLLARFAWYSIVPLILFLVLVPLPRRALHLMFVVAVGLLIFDSFTYVLPRFSGLSRVATDLQPGHFPERAVDYLSGAKIDGKIHTNSSWGGYLLYRLHPPSTTLTDGRIAFGSEVAELLKQDKPSTREQMMDRAYERFGVDLVVVRPPAFAIDRPKPARWVRLYGDPIAEVWAVRDEKITERIARTKAYAVLVGRGHNPPVNTPQR